MKNPEPSDLNSLVKSYGELGWFDDADNCCIKYKNYILYNDSIGFKIGIYFVKNMIYLRNLDTTRVVINKLKYLINSRIFNFICHSTNFLLHFLSLFLYGHGVRLRWPIFTGFLVILISAYIYTHGGQANSFNPDGIELSSKVFILTTQVGGLTGFCE